MPVGRAYVLPLLTLTLFGCAALRVEGVRHPNEPGTLEPPVAFIIFESSTPASFARALERALSREMQWRHIDAAFTIVPRLEDAKAGLVAKALADVAGCIILAPSDGSPRLNGVTDPVYYDVRALRLTQHPGPAVPGSGPDGTTPLNDGTGKYKTVWRGRAHARGGFTAENLAEVASKIVARLVADRVLPGTTALVAPRAPSDVHAAWSPAVTRTPFRRPPRPNIIESASLQSMYSSSSDAARNGQYAPGSITGIALRALQLRLSSSEKRSPMLCGG